MSVDQNSAAWKALRKIFLDEIEKSRTRLEKNHDRDETFMNRGEIRGYRKIISKIEGTKTPIAEPNEDADAPIY